LPIADCRLKKPIGNRQSEIGNALPARFHNTGNLSRQRQLTKANPAKMKLAQISARAAAPAAARVSAGRKLRLAIRFRD
jgi:hypothetical protein